MKNSDDNLVRKHINLPPELIAEMKAIFPDLSLSAIIKKLMVSFLKANRNRALEKIEARSPERLDLE